MGKLSRTNKYRDYRNEINNDSEKEIATRELKELQEKIILNEKRFGDSSRTESDLIRGRKDTSYDNLYDDYKYPKRKKHKLHKNSNNKTDHVDDLDDIFSELNKYKNFSPHRDYNNEKDDYIRRIKDIVNHAGVQYDEPDFYSNYDSYYQEQPISQERVTRQPQPVRQQMPYPQPQPVRQQPYPQPRPIRQQAPYPQQQQYPNDVFYYNGYNAPQNGYYAEFEEQPTMQQQTSQFRNVLRQPNVRVPYPQQDYGQEFQEISENVNSFVQQIESSNNIAQQQYVPPSPNISPSRTVQVNRQEQPYNAESQNPNNEFANSLQAEADQYTNNFVNQSPIINTEIGLDVQNQTIRKSEVTGQLKEEYDNTVSLEVNKLMDEISSSRNDYISTNEMINDNRPSKNEINDDRSGKTIAFETGPSSSIPDNTIILSQPDIEDSSIHTMSFETEELDIEREERGNTLLNVILSILIIISVGVLGVIIYFFLITRGII